MDSDPPGAGRGALTESDELTPVADDVTPLRILVRRLIRRNLWPPVVHHHGSDLESCPRCLQQSNSCDCLWAGEEHLSDDWVEDMKLLFERSGWGDLHDTL